MTANDFGQVISDHIAQLHTTYGMTYLVADSALYSAENLQKLADTSLKWITRVPATLSEAQAILAQAHPQTMAALTKGYRYRASPRAMGAWSNAGSSSTRSIASRRPSAPSTSSWRKQSDQEVQAFRGLPHRVCL